MPDNNMFGNADEEPLFLHSFTIPHPLYLLCDIINIVITHPLKNDFAHLLSISLVVNIIINTVLFIFIRELCPKVKRDHKYVQRPKCELVKGSILYIRPHFSYT